MMGPTRPHPPRGESGDEVTIANNIQNKQDYQSDITDAAVEEIKQSVIFQYNWPQLLSSAPIAINSTGLAFLASASTTAATVELKEPKDGFRFLR